MTSANQHIYLSALIQGRDGYDWIDDLDGWDDEAPCEWEGITCEGGNVVSIKLPGYDLEATIPPALGELSLLKNIDLSKNMIRGPIPISIFELPHLETIDLSENEITGTLRCFSSPALKSMRLDSNLIAGTIPEKCPGLGYNKKLERFSAIRNNLQGTIPSIFTKMTKLHTLSLSENKLSGTISNGLGKLPNMQYLYLDNNYFQGTVPSSLGSASLLELWVQENLLSGTIPADISDLDNLFNFYVDGNQFTGTVPKDLCRDTLNADFFKNAPKAKDRDYCQSIACPTGFVSEQGIFPCTACPQTYFNPYIGRVGYCIDISQHDILMALYDSADGKEWTNMKVPWSADDEYYCGYTGVSCDNKNNVIGIDLKGRGLSGTIPEELGFLQFLKKLDLSDNYLFGYLPSDFRWAPLETLDISGNQIKGIVPYQLCNSPINSNGKDGNYNCNNIACAVGSYSPTGKDNCEQCYTGTFIGSKTCHSMMSKNGSVGGGGSQLTNIGVTFLFAFVMVTCTVAFCSCFLPLLYRWCKDKGEVRKNEEETMELSHTMT